MTHILITHLLIENLISHAYFRIFSHILSLSTQTQSLSVYELVFIDDIMRPHVTSTGKTVSQKSMTASYGRPARR